MPDSTRGRSSICEYPGCTRTVWQDPDGSFSACCGTGHREAMARLQPMQACKHCEIRPAYVENGRQHDFCGRRCAAAFQTGQNSPVSPPAYTINTGDPCGITGCRRQVFVDRHGTPSQYCSNRHRLDAVRTGKAEACLNCVKWPKSIFGGTMSDFCSKKCGQEVMESAPIILDIDTSHDSFQKVAAQFKDKWEHPTPVPTIVKIWKIYGRKDITDKFERYKLSVERRTGLQNANTKRRWHGTVRACSLGDDADKRGFCQQPNCCLCNIIRSSFQLAKAGQRTNFGRFGAGIYTSATSSKANDYVGELGRSRYKAMLLNLVVMGSTTKLTVTDQSLIAPPSGFDSVVGEPGGDLNYDESIVYTNDAIRPLYLVIYHDSNSPGQPAGRRTTRPAA